MQIKVNYRAQLSALIKKESELITAKNVKEILQYIKSQYSADAEKSAKKMLIAVNGQSILMLKHFKTILKDGDEVSFFPICGGG